MIHAIDRNEQFTTYWHVPPPHPWATFMVYKDTWGSGQEGVARHVFAWSYPPLPAPDRRGWVAAPTWWREMGRSGDGT